MLLLFLSFKANSQCNSFYKTYNFNNTNSWGRDIVELPDTTYIITGSIQLANPFGKQPYAIRINNCGDTIWSNYFITNYMSIRNCEFYSSEKVIVFSTMLDTLSSSLSSYSFLDIDSGYLGGVSSFLTATNGGTFVNVKRMHDGKYFCTIDPFLDPLHSMNVVDSNLNYLYNGIMPGGYIMNPVEDNDGNFYVCSATEQFPYYIVAKYDSMLNQQWYLNTGTANSGSPFWGYATYGIEFASDSNLLVASEGPDWQLMKVNRFTGDTMWTKFYADSTNINAPWQIINYFTKTTTGKFVAVTINGVVLFMDDNGTILYTSSQNVGGTYHKIEPTLSGGVLLVGFEDVSPGPISRMKVVKLDSLGNTVFTSTVELPGGQSDMLSVYPNPAYNLLNVNYSGSKTAQPLQATVYNTEGRACMQFELSDSEPVNISQLPNGLYLLKITNENTAMSRVFMVSH